MSVLVLAEHLDGELDSVTLQLLGKGREVADRQGVPLSALLVGYQVEPLAQALLSTGIDTLTVVDHPALEQYNPETYCKVVWQAIQEASPRLFLLGATFWGMEIGPFVATKMGASLATNCVGVGLSDAGLLRVTRPLFRDTLQMEMEFPEGSTVVASVQRGALPTEPLTQRSAEVVRMALGDDLDLHTRVVEVVSQPPGEVDITKADLLISVGRGIQSAANIQQAQELADVLGGHLACSRALTDIGWLPHDLQVGLSGKTVNAKVYVAMGISGASQHIAGMRDCQCIIAINKDATAPIFRFSHYGVVTDMIQLLPLMIEEAKRRKAAGLLK